MTFPCSTTKAIARTIPCGVILALALSISGCGTNFSQFYFGDLFGGGKKALRPRRPPSNWSSTA